MSQENQNTTESSHNFIEDIIQEDLNNNKNEGRVKLRFPPEPNGYLHIGHAKSICLNFGLAYKYNGTCNLRFDDTNPMREEVEYIESIKEDVQWLGFQWHDTPYYASDYFDHLYEWAVKLIKMGKAYVCEMSPEEISQTRGTPTEPGKESPWRDRPIEENLDLFERMKNGEFEDGRYLLRARIDMASPNMHLRDPVMYRIKHAYHHRTGDKWCIYPMYDWAHGQSDFAEGITHSLCTLEFEVHRPLYDWFVEQIKEGEYRPRQIEFAPLNLTYTIVSKRKLQKLISDGYAESWDDPRMPTLSGLRRRGYTPESIRNFIDKVGVTKNEALTDVALLEHSIREDLNKKAHRFFAVLDPVKVIIDNYPEGQEEQCEVTNNPEDESAGTRNIPFSKEVYIERNDFMEDPPKKFFRLAPGKEVRLKGAYIIQCTGVDKDEDGNIRAIHCNYDPDTKSGQNKANRKVKGTLHWVSVAHAHDAKVRVYDRLFLKENPSKVEEGEDFTASINPDNLTVVNAKVEPGLKDAQPGEKYQFQRQGYYCVDTKLSEPGNPVFNKTVSLKDTWAKKQKQQQKNSSKK